MKPSLLTVRNAVVEFATQGGGIRALDGVSIDVEPGEVLAVVGESGCGKSTLAKAILGIQPLQSGEVLLQGKRVMGTPRNIAQHVGMVWQDPFASLDPRWTIERSVAEPGRIARRPVDVDRLLTDVGLDPGYKKRFPHQLSGGQRQRAAIARALALEPDLVICDEPTAALDLSIRAQILNLLLKIREERQCAFLYISHDLVTVRFLATRVAVMYLGRIVETGLAGEVLSEPRHPYTMALLESAPTLEKLRNLPATLYGELPDPRARFLGCRFAPRCPRAESRCETLDPPESKEGGRSYFCHNPVERLRVDSGRA